MLVPEICCAGSPLLRVALSVRGARVRFVDRLTPKAYAGRGHTIRVIKVHRAGCRIAETNVGMSLSPKVPKKKGKEEQKERNALSESRTPI